MTSGDSWLKFIVLIDSWSTLDSGQPSVRFCLFVNIEGVQKRKKNKSESNLKSKPGIYSFWKSFGGLWGGGLGAFL